MNNLVIRSSKEEDLRQISEIVVEDWQIAYRGIIDNEFLNSMSVEKQIQKEIDRYHEYIVATNGNEVLGYAWPRMIEDEVADCEIVALYVRNEKRKKGIGKKLLLYSINHFRELGGKRMIIWCLKDNLESRKFYEKMDGREFKISSHSWGNKDYDIISFLFDLV